MLPMPFIKWTTYAGHSGVDFPYGRGTIFRASGHGFVRGVSYSARGGYYMYVNYDGYPAVGYHHMDSPSPFVRAGTEVWEGTPLGYIGSKGQNSTGPHLHSEVEGRPGSAGYWTVFDKNRAVGATPGGGGSGGSTSPGTPSPETPYEEYEMIRIQAPNRGIALIGAGYFRPLANNDEVAASNDIISKHVSSTDKDYDLRVSMAVGGQIAGNLPAVIRNAARPLRLYRNNGAVIAMSDRGKTWPVPSRDYEILLDALGLAGPDVIRDINDNELAFMKQVFGVVNPDPETEIKVDAALAISEADAERIASKIQVDSKDEIAEAVRSEFASNPLK